MSAEGLNKWIAEWYEKNDKAINDFMADIWAHPETGLKTFYAAKASAAFAKAQGFTKVLATRAGCGIKEDPDANSLIAEYGSGRPVIGIVGELDALPGLGSKNVDHHEPIEGPGHGCGHCLIAGSAMGGACALRYAMEKEGIQGTVRLIEAPAEEIGRGKALLAQDGVFKDLDMAIMWHPGNRDFSAEPQHQLCVMSATFEFHGKSAHAAGSPWMGRSALDAVQLMNMGCEFLREHVKKECFIHYQILNGGGAPNVVPDYASVKYLCRALSTETVQDLYDRVVKCAEGAAHMTDTKVDVKLRFIMPYFYINMPLSRHLHDVSLRIPPFEYTDEEYAFARNVISDYLGEPGPEAKEDILPGIRQEFNGFDEKTTCTDAADMSYFCPTVHMHGGGEVRLAPSHHWAVTACAGTSIGRKAALFAGKVLAQGAYEALLDPKIIEESWAYQKESNIIDYYEMYGKLDIVEED